MFDSVKHGFVDQEFTIVAGGGSVSATCRAWSRTPARISAEFGQISSAGRRKPWVPVSRSSIRPEYLTPKLRYLVYASVSMVRYVCEPVRQRQLYVCESVEHDRLTPREQHHAYQQFSMWQYACEPASYHHSLHGCQSVDYFRKCTQEHFRKPIETLVEV